MTTQGKTPKQQHDSLMIFEFAFWIVVLIVCLILAFK